MSAFEHLEVLSDIIDNATFPNRAIKRAARDFVTELKRDLIAAGYECADKVSETQIKFQEAVDLYLEQADQEKKARLEKASLAEDDDES